MNVYLIFSLPLLKLGREMRRTFKSVKCVLPSAPRFRTQSGRTLSLPSDFSRQLALLFSAIVPYPRCFLLHHPLSSGASPASYRQPKPRLAEVRRRQNALQQPARWNPQVLSAPPFPWPRPGVASQ